MYDDGAKLNLGLYIRSSQVSMIVIMMTMMVVMMMEVMVMGMMVVRGPWHVRQASHHLETNFGAILWRSCREPPFSSLVSDPHMVHHLFQVYLSLN